jgi:predicted acetyltransferase
MTIEVGLARDEAEREAFAAAAVQSLGFPADIEWLPRYDDTRIVVARVGGAVAGACAVIDMGQWFGGRSVPLAGVNAVGVFPQHRGHGVASAMMRWIVEDVRARGLPLSGLYPATQPVYRRVGYEQAGTWTEYAIPMELLSGGDRELEVTPTGMDELELLRPVYEASCRREPGKLDRNRWAWQRILDPIHGPSYAYKVGQGDSVQGYVSYRHRKRHDRHGFNLSIIEMVANTDAARRRMWSLLHDHRSMASTVFVNGPPTCVELMWSAEQGAEVSKSMRWMIRIEDVASALDARGYSPHVSARVTIAVSDQVLPDNAGVYGLTLEGGAMTVTRGGDPEIELDVRALASLYSGYASAEQLAAAGLVRGDARSLAAATAIFAGPAPWLPEIY